MVTPPEHSSHLQIHHAPGPGPGLVDGWMDEAGVGFVGYARE